jgi:hypothetical protein
MNFNWHKIARRRQAVHRERNYHKVALIPAVIYAPEPALRPYELVWRDTKGNPISLPRVTILEKYDAKGNPR